jgi:Family of unknown function (DUF695)
MAMKCETKPCSGIGAGAWRAADAGRAPTSPQLLATLRFAVPILTILALVALAGFLALRFRSRSSPNALKRPDTPASGDPIEAFWNWWETAKGPVADAIEACKLADFSAAISERVHAIDPALAWELGPGVKSSHHLCVTSEGNGRLRITAERWLSRAPSPDAIWEYYPARQPSRGDPKLTLKLADVELEYKDARYGLAVDEARRVVHVVVFHPKFRDLADEQRATATMLMLDDALGEDGVERWLGNLRNTDVSDEAGETRSALIGAVDGLARAPNEDSFALCEATGEDGMVNLSLVNFAIKRLDHLLMESHIAVTIAYPGNDRGFYSDNVGEDLNAMEDALLAALGNDAVYIGHETGRGRRVIHLHVATSGPAQRLIAEWERSFPTWEIETVAKADPQWEVLKRW